MAQGPSITNQRKTPPYDAAAAISQLNNPSIANRHFPACKNSIPGLPCVPLTTTEPPPHRYSGTSHCIHETGYMSSPDQKVNSRFTSGSTQNVLNKS